MSEPLFSVPDRPFPREPPRENRQRHHARARRLDVLRLPARHAHRTAPPVQHLTEEPVRVRCAIPARQEDQTPPPAHNPLVMHARIAGILQKMRPSSGDHLTRSRFTPTRTSYANPTTPPSRRSAVATKPQAKPGNRGVLRSVATSTQPAKQASCQSPADITSTIDMYACDPLTPMRQQ